MAAGGGNVQQQRQWHQMTAQVQGNGQQPPPQRDAAPARTSSTTRNHLTDVSFSSLPISAETKRALAEVMHYDMCTLVQAQSIPAVLGGRDHVVKAKTGTGKTLAFLIPAIERMQKLGVPQGSLAVLILSPTRELAMQIATEAEQVGHFQRLSVQTVVGGTNVKTDASRLRNKPPHILVATPGRLDDLLKQGALSRQAISRLQTLIFDEGDRLMDMGFRPQVDAILQQLPSKETRQTVLFSATFPKDIRELTGYALRSGYSVIDTVGESDMHAHEQVQQSAMVVPLENAIASVWSVIAKHIQEEPDFKVMVFFTTARITQIYAELFNKMGCEVLELHSRKSQAYRTRVAEEFRKGARKVLFSSDVSARGVDYPDVTMVVQVGMAADRDQYVHRVGRTARAGKQGEAVLILQDMERGFLRSLTDLPLQKLPALDAPAQTLDRIRQAASQVPEQSKGAAYQAFLGFYNGHLKAMGLDKPGLVQQAANFAYSIGCADIPEITPRAAGMMGLKAEVEEAPVEAKAHGR
eukprot:jgi/Astpho2/6086/Aster-04033